MNKKPEGKIVRTSYMVTAKQKKCVLDTAEKLQTFEVALIRGLIRYKKEQIEGRL